MVYYFLGHILITVLPPVKTEGLTGADIPRLMEETRATMVTTFQTTSSQLQAQLLADKAN